MAFRNNTKIGKHYEKASAIWLESHGYEVLEYGKSFGRGKGSTAYDLIVKKDGEILYVDVKSTCTSFGVRGKALKRLIDNSNGNISALLFIFNGKILGMFKLIIK